MYKNIGIGFAALLALTSVSVEAMPMAIDFTVASSVGGSVTGSGTAFTDSSHLDPSDYTLVFADLMDMTMTLSGISGVPNTTTFTRADLDDPDFSWILSVDSSGTINDLNFFMRFDGTNSDGYSMDGFAPFNFVLCDGPSSGGGCGNSTTLDSLVISISNVRQVPEPGSLALLGLGLAGLRVMRRKA